LPSRLRRQAAQTPTATTGKKAAKIQNATSRIVARLASSVKPKPLATMAAAAAPTA